MSGKVNQIAAAAGKKGFLFLVALLLPVAVGILWHQASTRGWVPVQILPPPSTLWDSFLNIWETGELKLNVLASLKRLGWSFLLGAGGGLLIGSVMAVSRTVEDLLIVMFQVVNLIPTFGWLPVLIVVLGFNETLAAVLIAQAIFIAVAVNTFQALRQVPQSQLELARIYRLGFVQSFIKIILPSALPQLFVGLRSGVSNGWIALVVVELLVSSEGIGYLMSQGRSLMQMDLVLLGVVLIGLIGWGLDAILTGIENYLRRWQPKSLGH
jgi:sulfonate transport system permease protein